MSENYGFEGFTELTPEMLEQVTGGVVSDKAETVMSALIKALKKDTTAVHTREETIGFVLSNLMDNVLFEGVTEQDVIDYINANW